MGLFQSKEQTVDIRLERRVPDPVEGLEGVIDPKRPSITLRWRPPISLRNATAIDFLIRVTEVRSSETVDETRLVECQSSYSRPVTITYTNSSLEPLKEYSFKVMVDNKVEGVDLQGEPSSVQLFFDWYCRHPNCKKSRLRRSSERFKGCDKCYDFCSIEHKCAFDEIYCLYPECTSVKSSKTKNELTTRRRYSVMYSFALFCSTIYSAIMKSTILMILVFSLVITFLQGNLSLKYWLVFSFLFVFVVLCTCLVKDFRHLRSFYHMCTPERKHFCFEHETIVRNISGSGYLVNVKPSSEEFKRIKKMFDDSWCIKKGRCPKVQTIIAIVNPAIESAFDAYLKTLPGHCVISEMYFHGTRLSCKIEEYQAPCSNDDCSVCAIVKYGFRKGCIRHSMYQRFGQGFYFAPNSSKSNDYCTSIDLNYSAMLVCEVAPGKKHFLLRSLPSLQQPPCGYHSVYGKSKFLFFWGDLNYDEIVIFESEAICPRYVLIFS